MNSQNSWSSKANQTLPPPERDREEGERRERQRHTDTRLNLPPKAFVYISKAVVPGEGLSLDSDTVNLKPVKHTCNLNHCTLLSHSLKTCIQTGADILISLVFV